jgi:hypothetical protein
MPEWAGPSSGDGQPGALAEMILAVAGAGVKGRRRRRRQIEDEDEDDDEDDSPGAGVPPNRGGMLVVRVVVDTLDRMV